MGLEHGLHLVDPCEVLGSLQGMKVPVHFPCEHLGLQVFFENLDDFLQKLLLVFVVHLELLVHFVDHCVLVNKLGEVLKDHIHEVGRVLEPSVDLVAWYHSMVPV